jgi:hypothetical protein
MTDPSQVKPSHTQRALAVLRHARMRGSLQFVLILPDGSKSLVPAEWTDFGATTGPPPGGQFVGYRDDLLRLRGLVDGLLRRTAAAPVTSGAGQENHAATVSELPRHPHPGDASVGTTRRPAKTNRHRDSRAPHDQCDPNRQEPGARQ